MSQPTTKFDVHQEITNRIVDALETAGTFQLPWIANKSGNFARPVNVASKKPYNGVNILSLWVSALTREFPSNIWGTYRQWQTAGEQVRKGEKASLVVFYKTIDVESANPDTGESERGERLLARASWVFNAAQLAGFDSASVAIPDRPAFDPVDRAERFAKATGARIIESGDKACYVPAQDTIHIPERRRFTGSETSTAVETFYATLFHELTHWTAAKSRLDRDLSGRFGTESYAVEELVAELGAAFLCGDLGITPQVREDHTAYIKNWLSVLKADKKAIFTAASKASEAANWLLARESLDAA